MGPRAGIGPPAAARSAEYTRPGCARAGRMLAGQPARGAAARGSPEQRSGRTGPRRVVPGGRGRGGAAQVASRTSRCCLLQPSLVELTPPWRARPLHKRPPRWRRRTPTRSDPPREEESAQRHGYSPPRRRRQSSPPPLPTLPPLTGNSCGLRATKLAAVPAPPWDFLLVQSAQPLLLLDNGLRHSPLPRLGLLPTPVCPSRLSLGASRQPRPSRPRRVPGLVARLKEPAPGAPPPPPLSTEPHVGRTAAAAARNRRKWPGSAVL